MSSWKEALLSPWESHRKNSTRRSGDSNLSNPFWRELGWPKIATPTGNDEAEG